MLGNKKKLPSIKCPCSTISLIKLRRRHYKTHQRGAQPSPWREPVSPAACGTVWEVNVPPGQGKFLGFSSIHVAEHGLKQEAGPQASQRGARRRETGGLREDPAQGEAPEGSGSLTCQNASLPAHHTPSGSTYEATKPTARPQEGKTVDV